MTRREAIKLAGMAALGTWAGTSCASTGKRDEALKLGVASYSLSNLPAEAVIANLK